MSGHRAGFVMALAVAGAFGIVVGSWMPSSDAAPKRRRKPAEVNVVQSVPLEMSVTGTPLPVDFSTFPAVAVSSLPAVAVASLPTTTHLGRPADELVVLNMTNAAAAPIFVRCHDDGTRDSTEFSVPAGSKLVVTDVDWMITASGLTHVATLRLFVENKTSSTRCLVFAPTGATTNVPSGTSGSPTGFGSTGLHAGFVVGSGARVVADLRRPEFAGNDGTTLAAITGDNTMIVLRGYLVAVP